MSDRDETAKKPAGMSRRFFLGRGAAAAAGVTVPRVDPSAPAHRDAERINELLGQFGKACAESKRAEEELTDIHNFMDPEHGRMFYDTVKTKDFAGQLTGDIQQMQAHLTARKAAFEALRSVLSDTPFAVPFSTEDQAHSVITAAMKGSKITPATLEEAFTGDQQRLQGLLDFAVGNYDEILKTQAAQRAASYALAEAFPYDRGGRLSSGTGPEGMSPQEFWRLPPEKVVSHVKEVRARKEEAEAARRDKESENGYQEKCRDAVAGLGRFFGLRFKSRDGNFVASMEWPENADMHRFEGAMRALVASGSRYGFMRENDPAGGAIPAGHEFFKGTLAPGNQVAFSLPQHAAIMLVEEISRVRNDEFYFDPTQSRLRSERLPETAREYLEKKENVNQAVERLECLRTFGGGKWAQKVSKKDDSGPQKTVF